MDGKQLKNSILQWAIQGKLVPQNPKDEPAQKLLERITSSRHSERSEESSKRSKKTSKNPTSRIYRENGVWYEQVGNAEPKDISEDIPFEIPENWAWCRFSQVISVASNLVDSSKYLEYKHIAPDNIEKGTGKLFSCKTVAEDKVISNNHLFRKGQIIYSKIRPLLRKCVIAPFDGLCSADMYPLKTDIEDTYVVKLLLSDMFNKQVADICASRVKMPKINQEELSGILLPLPPLAEQKRIVAKLEQVLPLADEYGTAQEELDKLNKELPEALKKSILQQAIQGKLVPQNPKDEPAQKLLERIASSRHSEQSEESSKRSKKTSKNPTSRIYCENGVWYEQLGDAEPKDISDEIPFGIPTSWVWCRLGQCSDYGATKEKAKSFDGIKDSWSLDLEDVEKNSGRIVKRLKVCERKIVGEKVVFRKGQVLYSKLRPYLKKILVAPEDGVCSSEIVPFSPFDNLDPNYLVTVLKSPHVDYTINLVTYGVKMPRVGTDTMLNLLIPIPPLAEQKRIVIKLEQLFKVL